MATEFTETQLFNAWRLLEGVARGRTSNADERIAAVQPAMNVLEKELEGLGFVIVDNELTPKPPTEEEPPAEEPMAAEESEESDDPAAKMTRTIHSRGTPVKKK